MSDTVPVSGLNPNPSVPLPVSSRAFLAGLPTEREALQARKWTRAERAHLKRLNLWLPDRWQSPMGPHIERLLQVVGGSRKSFDAGDQLLRMPIDFSAALRQGFTSWGQGCSVPWGMVDTKWPVPLDVLALAAVRNGGGLDLRSPLLTREHRPADIDSPSQPMPQSWPAFIRRSST